MYDPPDPPLAGPAAVPGVPAAAVPGVVTAGAVGAGVVGAGVVAAGVVAAGAPELGALREGRRLSVDVDRPPTSCRAGAAEATVACPAGPVEAAAGASTGTEVASSRVAEGADGMWAAAADALAVVADGAAELEPMGFRSPGPAAAITPTRVEAAKTRAARRFLEKHERKREGPLVVRHGEQRSVFTK